MCGWWWRRRQWCWCVGGDANCCFRVPALHSIIGNSTSTAIISTVMATSTARRSGLSYLCSVRLRLSALARSLCGGGSSSCDEFSPALPWVWLPCVGFSCLWAALPLSCVALHCLGSLPCVCVAWPCRALPCLAICCLIFHLSSPYLMCYRCYPCVTLVFLLRPRCVTAAPRRKCSRCVGSCRRP